MVPDVLPAVALVAGAVYATRAGGYWLGGRLRLPERWLRHVPGAVLAALAAPELARGPVEAAAGAATLGVALASRSLPLAIAAGILAATVLRAL